MNAHSCLAGLCTASLTLAQGAVFQVSPAGPVSDVQTAVNMAANGDVIEVAPGTYPPFAVTGKQLSVVAIDPITNSPATFTVTGTPNTPAIRIDGLAQGQLVTVSGAHINHTNPTAPAIVIDGSPMGSVRLLDVRVTTMTALGNVPYDGVVEVANTGCAWFDRVRVGDHRVFANGASGTTGVSGLYCDDARLHLNRCDFRGLRSANPFIDGGDGLRTVGPVSSAWMVDSLLMGGMSSAGAVTLTLGGHAVHDFDGLAARIAACDCTLTTSVSTVAPFAVAGVASLLAVCPDYTIGRTDIVPFTTALRIGTGTTVAVSADIGNRPFVLVISSAFDHVQIPALFSGAFLFRDTVVTMAVGMLGASPAQLPLNLPAVPAAIGLQATLQSALLAPNGINANWSMSTAAAFTIR